MPMTHLSGVGLANYCHGFPLPISSPFNISDNHPDAFYILVLLLGGVKIKIKDKEVCQRRNFLVIGAPLSHHVVSKNLSAAFSDLHVDFQGKKYSFPAQKTILRYILSQRSNHSLFRPLLNELLRSFFNNQSGRGLSSFVHLYRAFENMSFSFPLFYCRYQTEFLKTYNLLKDFFKGGELEFCSNFYKHLIRSEGVQGTIINIKYICDNHEGYIDLLTGEANLMVDKKNNIMALTKINEYECSIDIEHCFDLIVSLRNKYFHHLSGSNSSLSSSQIIDPDDFFYPLNQVGYQVFGFIFTMLIKAHI